MSLVLRHVYNGIMKENCICFIYCHSIYNKIEIKDGGLMGKNLIKLKSKW